MDSDLPLSLSLEALTDKSRALSDPFRLRGFTITPADRSAKAFCDAFLAHWKRSDPSPGITFHSGRCRLGPGVGFRCMDADPKYAFVSLSNHPNFSVEDMRWLMARNVRESVLVSRYHDSLRFAFPTVDIVTPSVLRSSSSRIKHHGSDISHLEIITLKSKKMGSCLDQIASAWTDGAVNFDYLSSYGLAILSVRGAICPSVGMVMRMESGVFRVLSKIASDPRRPPLQYYEIGRHLALFIHNCFE